MNFLEHALEYHQRGWSILPISRVGKWKKPALQEWKPYQTRQPSEHELRAWFKIPNLAGLAVVLGPVSGDIYCRDFDVGESYQHWASKHPELASVLPTVAAKRGPHVYFRSPNRIRTRDYGDGEVRGIGGYSVLPPSLHHSGHTYTWKIPLPSGLLPVVDSRGAGLCRDWSCTENTETTERPEMTQPTEPTDENRANRPGSGWPLGFDVGEFVASAVPSNRHQNHKLLFRLARAVKALEKRFGRELSQTELRELFDGWYDRAAPFLREGQSRDEYWFEFLEGYEHVKYPLGEEVITKAWEKAQRSSSPRIAMQFESSEIRLVVSLCRELQRVAGRQAFYLSCRTVQRLLHHETHTKAALWLRGLVRSKIIKEVEKGGALTNKASRYKYLHPPNE